MTQPVHPRPIEFHIAEDADTIEMELSAEQLFALSQAAAAADLSPVRVPVALPPSLTVTVSVPTPVPAADELLPNLLPAPQTRAAVADSPAPRSRRGARVAVALSIAAASIVSGVIGYLMTPRAPPAPVAAAPAPSPVAPEQPPPPAPPSMPDPPMQYRNPFDAKEVFEFPAGTSPAAARDAVADLLLERARDRLISSPGAKREVRKPAAPVAPMMPATMDDQSLQAVLTPPSAGRR